MGYELMQIVLYGSIDRLIGRSTAARVRLLQRRFEVMRSTITRWL